MTIKSPTRILILGAGPAGLSTAIALAITSTPTNPLHITVLELRPRLETIGGTVNLTMLALRYLDHLGVGPRLRPKGVQVGSLRVVAARSGKELGSLFSGMDNIRVARHHIVESILQTVQEDHAQLIDVVFGKRTVSIAEVNDGDGGGKVVLEMENGDTFEGDILLGCDGLHSAARTLYVEPERREVYSGRAVARGHAVTVQKGEANLALANGRRAMDTVLGIQGRYGMMLLSFSEPTRSQISMGDITGYPEPSGNVRDGWKVMGEDREKLKRGVSERWSGGSLRGLAELLDRCDDWTLYPVYKLPPGGAWNKGRVLLLGDAAHAMPPQGESTARTRKLLNALLPSKLTHRQGIAIEDGILFARLFERRQSRSLEHIFSDYETLRRSEIDQHYKSANFRWESAAQDSSWLWAYLMEWFTWGFMILQGRKMAARMGSDVRNLELPE
ncbi:FAD/NAD(P)-binding domain-containing protein [Xylariaceae sp. FL0016]|nr:FAD/NAD(P)-binding domain-containing protein [Xylariaceae sp. FL0016]